MTDAQLASLEQMSQRLLQQLRAEQWEAVAVSSSPYLAAVQQIMNTYQQAGIAEEKKAMAEQLQAIQLSQTEIVERLRARMQQLEKEMIRLQQGKTGCQGYAAQNPRCFS